MNLNDFINWALAQGSVAKYNDGNYKGECVSLINQYCWRVLGVPADAWGHAKDWATNASVLQYFTPVDTVWPSVGGLLPGDILVYDHRFGRGFGHIEIALGNGLALGQNRSYSGGIVRSSVINGYTTILRRKGDMIQNTQRHFDIINQDWRIATGRSLTRKEFEGHFVGRDSNEARTTIHMSSETAEQQKLISIGRTAAAEIQKRDNMIVALNKSLEEAKKQTPSSDQYVPVQNLFYKKG